MAPKSSSLALTSKVIAKNGNRLVDEKIDERILRLLGLEQVFDIDYDTYTSLLREKVAASRMMKQGLPTEEVELITNEFKRVKNKKGRFKVKKITADSFKKGTAVSINLNQKRLKGLNRLALPPTIDKTSRSAFEGVTNSLNEIIGYLKNQNKLQSESNERARKERESSKRASTESRLEKGFAVAIKVAERVLAPIKSLLSRIIDFFMAIFWGKVFLKLLDWFADPSNKKKIDSLFRFFGDHWPKLLALYLRFGTGLGKFVGGLTKLVFFGTRKLLQTVAQLIGAKGAARFLGGRGGKLVAAGLQVATTVGTTMALSGGIEQFVGKGESDKAPKVPNYFGGGFVNMFKGLKGFFGGGPGFVSGTKGVDKIPAMLSDGEIVFSTPAVKYWGADRLLAMNKEGGGTNKPKMISGVPHAAGGGMVGDSKPSSSNQTMSGSPDFWKLAALASKEDSIHPQGQADVAQAIYNRMAIRSYPGGANIGKIIVAPGQFEPTFKNPSAWANIKDKKTAAAAAGNSQKVDMAAKSITNPVLQRESSKFVGGRTDFMGESQKKNMKPGDITRGPGFNFHGWFYDAKLPKPASIPKIISSNQTYNINNKNSPTSPSSKSSKPSKSPGIFERLSSGFSSLTSGMSSLMSPSARPKEPRYASGGMAGGPPAVISKNPVKARNISPPSRPPVVVRALDNSGPKNMSVPRAGGSPQVPSFAVSFNENRERVLAMHGIA